MILKIIAIYLGIGLVITIICSGRSIIEDIKSGKYSVLMSILGSIVLMIMSPVWVICGIIQGIIALFKH